MITTTIMLMTFDDVTRRYELHSVYAILIFWGLAQLRIAYHWSSRYSFAFTWI